MPRDGAAKKAVEIEGEKWVPNSIEDWGKEIGFSPTQTKYAAEHARKLNLMRTTMRSHKKRWVMHATLTSRGRVIIAGGKKQICPPIGDNFAPLV